MSNYTGFVKRGEALEVGPTNIHSSESVFSDPSIENRFQKLAGTLKRIAPKADDFLYFSAIMMHAAEAALVNSDGTPKLTSKGEPVQSHWEKKGESWRWICNDSNLRPYKNSNGDIFPEEELLKAHKVWIGKPLCVDHKSNSVDAIRGIILDTYYDRVLRRVIALCALDKVTYPDLAKKVSLGYSTCVSMGTAVGKAICSDCGTVARTEHDFCIHMKTKSCYGEINCDLQPIELSLVVNGADPQAKIRTIIAAANTLNNHLRDKEQEIVILSDSTSLEQDQLNKLKELENDLQKANEKLAELQEIITKEETSTAEPPYGQTSGRYNDPSDTVNDTEFGLNLPERLASNNDALISELKNLRASIEKKLFNMEKTLDKLHKSTKEEIMSNKDASMNKEAYFQGGGGVNEPTPGQKKYPVDPMNEKLRMEDKQMVGEPPFPDVGPVDGMHPSPESADQKDELERKKMLARADADQRSLRRAAALQKAKENIMNQKEAYFQGGGGVNEPEPHKVKYPIDPLEGKLRVKEDKQMVGQKPFPGVGPVDGLHPSPQSADPKDELARKKLLQRASLKARFVRVANTDGTDDLGSSGWQVYAKDDNGEKLVFTASVDEISGGRSDALFDVIATKDFGSKMLEKIRAFGLDQAVTLYKRGQAVTMPGTAPAAPADAGGPGPVPDMGAPAAPAGDEHVDDAGAKGGDPKEVAFKLAEKVRDLSSDLLEAVRTLTGEQGQMGDLEEGLEALPKAAAETLIPLNNMRKELHGALLSGMKKSLGELREHAEELKLIASVVESDTTVNKEYVDTIVEDAFEDAKKAVDDGFGLMTAYAKYTRGTAGLLKRAEEAEEEVLRAYAADVNDAKAKAKSKSKSSTKSKSTDDSDADDGNDAKSKSKSKSSDEMCADDDNDAKSKSKSKSTDDSDADDANVSDSEDNSDVNDNLFADFEDESMSNDVNNHMHDHDDYEEDDLELPEGHEHGDVDLEDLELPESMEEDMSVSDENETDVELPPGAPVPPGAKALKFDPNFGARPVPGPSTTPTPATPAPGAPAAPAKPGATAAAEFDLTTKEGRTAYRAKLAADATGKEDSGEIQSAESMPHSDMLDEADKLADGQTELDTKPSDSLGLVETLPEQQKADLQVAKAPPKVRKEAERLNQLISEGKVKVAELDGLVAQGLDPEVIKYWRQYYGEAGKEGSEFGKMLTTETYKAKVAEEMATYKVKVGRAYELANEMVKRGLLTDDRAAVTAQVEEIMKWNDEAFDSMNRVVAKHAPLSLKKEASVPQVGLIGSGDVYSTNAQATDFQSELDSAFAGRKY